MSEVQAATYNSQLIQNTAMNSGVSNSDKKAESSGDMVDFLSLLLVQLENQDPTDPMDTNEMTNQMVSYSQLEQSIDTNVQLEEMNKTLLVNNNFSAVSYLGTNMELNSAQSPIQDGSARWTYEIGQGVSNTSISITDVEGNIVYQGSGETESGRYNFNLDLKDLPDSVIEDNVLTLSVTSLNAQGEKIPSNISSFVNVEMVDTTGNAPQYQAGNLNFKDSDILKFYSSDVLAN